MRKRSVVEGAIDFSGLFESEVLIDLLLRCWEHPLADDEDFRNDLLESATQALHYAAAGNSLIDGLPASKTNFIAAIWYSESVALSVNSIEIPNEILEKRKKWLGLIRRSIPSCFHEQE